MTTSMVPQAQMWSDEKNPIKELLVAHKNDPPSHLILPFQGDHCSFCGRSEAAWVFGEVCPGRTSEVRD